MELIEEILTTQGKKLQLIKGDLTQLTESHKVDILVISAFPNDYVPTSSSLIGALSAAGVSVKQLAQQKEVDLRIPFHCWLSKEINFNNIKRILCFEPTDRRNPFSLIAGIFQSIMPFTITHSIECVAMPLLLTGDQGYAHAQVAKELVSTSLFWLRNGSLLKTIKIIEKTDSKIELIKKSIQIEKELYHEKSGKARYDFFISYSRKNAAIAKTIHEKLKNKFDIFFDTESIDIGANWLAKLNSSLQNSFRFIVCISPDYVESKMCKYEYTFCNLKLINDGDDFVLPVYVYSTNLPFPMTVLNYCDAREGALVKIEEFCDKLIEKYAFKKLPGIKEEQTNLSEQSDKKSIFQESLQNQTLPKKLENIDQFLKQKLKEQPHIIQLISDALLEHFCGLSVGHPITFLLIRPHGNEQIRLAKALAEFLFNDENGFIYFDMNQFQEEREAALLYGALPSDVGYDDGGLLVSKIKERPNSVVLFDQIEKAHSTVFDIFLEISDEGTMSDRLGRNGDFSKTIILFSCNVGDDLVIEGSDKKIIPTSSDFMQLMCKYFRSEFLARIYEFIPFH